MKKRILAFLGIIVLILIISLGFFYSPKIVRLKNIESVKAIYTYYGADKISDLSSEEVLLIQRLFNNKIATRDTLYCGFGKDVCIVIDNKTTFCFAGDMCPIVYWAEQDRYFSMSEKEYEELLALLEKHGFDFPCV